VDTLTTSDRPAEEPEAGRQRRQSRASRISRGSLALVSVVSAVVAIFLGPRTAGAHNVAGDTSKGSNRANNCYNQNYSSSYVATPGMTIGATEGTSFQNLSYFTGLSQSADIWYSGGHHTPSMWLSPRLERWHNWALFGSDTYSYQTTIWVNSDAIAGRLEVWSNICK